ncbi:MAG: glycosyltransferase family 2 protein [Verrucomicrobia bacterium]|nr:glycosyltransferase family 2 protein [Verrucomicrobiota bacterium]MBU4290865.1 glycosyltransferase family 2 protein [Verrucomicrobiota bacterium]MBU4429702.1 glycosyltransferase family 2 protein [Verrucomicrobiota bacterium]MBU4497805.1 glycosyltransferase family 2 protein [Verrucomicrobiota bacterium]MCG2680614.1 glycosyltransferase family 2 protein [Kiritimatiellia bacterium]
MLTGFDLLLLILYGLLMLVLTIYAAHAYLMLYLYRKNSARFVKHILPIADWPRITVQLPIYNERYVVERLIQAACALEYPRDRLEIQVLDDSNDETRQIALKWVAINEARGINIRHIHRVNRTGFKAGALRAGLETAQGEYLAILDADFVPAPDFLKKLIPYFSADNIGVVQARWGHLNGDYSLLTRGQTIGLDAHFVLEHGARNSSGLFINFNGTAGIWRKSAILSAGNWQDDTLTEDIDISYRAQLAGWKFIYVNDVVCPAEVPAEVYGLKNQQYRWAKGAIQTARKLLPIIWRNRAIPWLVKFEATVHLTNHLVFPILLFVALLSFPLLSIRIQYHETRLIFLSFLICIINAFSYPMFYIYAQREIYADWKRRILFLPVLLAGAMGLSVINSRAVFSALIGRKSAFNRTPKFNLGATKEHSWKGKQYRSRFNGTVLVELVLIVYLSLALIYAINNLQYTAIPFILIYWLGFMFIGMLSLAHAIKP